MARPLPSAASSRSNHHHAPDINLTALQGATTAFNTKDASPYSVKTRVQTMETSIFPDSSPNRHHDDAPQSHSPSDTDSTPPPELGSVKDKIGRFAANSRTTSPLSINQGHDALETDHRDLKFPVRSSTPQQIAARLASERSPVRDEISAGPGGMNRTVTPSRQSNKGAMTGKEYELLAPKPIRSPTAPSPALRNVLREDREPPPLPQKPPSIPRKPTKQTTLISSQSPSLAQLAAARSSPSPSPSSVSRKPPPLPSRSSTVSTSTTQNNSANPREANSSMDSLSFSTFSGDKKPSLPPRPRPNESPVFRAPRSQTHQGILLQDLERSKTPSIASLSTTSYNNSSSSTIDRSNSGIDEESLSNAIVASSLASARAPEPKKIPPTPPKPRRRSRSRSILSLGHHNNNHRRRDSHGRLSSPTKGLRQTLRDPPKPETQHNNHHHHRLPIHRHPHKHHEGDRKRYQGVVTEQERKRYEGVWAANKGLLIPTLPSPSSSAASSPTQSYHKALAQKYPPNAPDMVLNLVVRDIWSRSRLPPATLSQIWNLVDRQKNGLLSRDEFVVGMWLIDQQLKGHKLPTKVPNSVWDSVKRLVGVRRPPRAFPSHHHHHHHLLL